MHVDCIEVRGFSVDLQDLFFALFCQEGSELGRGGGGGGLGRLSCSVGVLELWCYGLELGCCL